MEIQLTHVTVRELAEGYQDDGEGGVRGYGGKLDIRPPYQREFVYDDKQRRAVVDSILKGFPLNVMYWAVRDDGTFEIIDGQQRTISVTQYVHNVFSFDNLYFHNQPDDIQNQILEYELMVYRCSGTASERLAWFRVINIAGATLEHQELRNAVYAGPWVSDAKRYFSRTSSPAYQMGKDYLSGTAIRQKYLETAIKWISGGNIEDHMAGHQHESTAVALWNYFRSVIDWVEAIFKKRDIMKGVDWGTLYNEYKDASLDPAEIEKEVGKLILDDDVGKKSGIYPYVLTRDETHLNVRAFGKGLKQKVFELQGGKCAICDNQFPIKNMEADHITPWSEGGKTEEENCQILCRRCNRRKSSK